MSAQAFYVKLYEWVWSIEHFAEMVSHEYSIKKLTKMLTIDEQFTEKLKPILERFKRKW